MCIVWLFKLWMWNSWKMQQLSSLILECQEWKPRQKIPAKHNKTLCLWKWESSFAFSCFWNPLIDWLVGLIVANSVDESRIDLWREILNEIRCVLFWSGEWILSYLLEIDDHNNSIRFYMKSSLNKNHGKVMTPLWSDQINIIVDKNHDLWYVCRSASIVSSCWSQGRKKQIAIALLCWNHWWKGVGHKIQPINLILKRFVTILTPLTIKETSNLNQLCGSFSSHFFYLAILHVDHSFEIGVL